MILDEVLPLPKESRFDVKKHKKQLFGMFIGEEKKVSFEVDNSIFGVVFDKFKKDIKMSLKVGGGVPILSLEYTGLSDLCRWCCAFGDKLKVISQNNVVLGSRNI